MFDNSRQPVGQLILTEFFKAKYTLIEIFFLVPKIVFFIPRDIRSVMKPRVLNKYCYT